MYLGIWLGNQSLVGLLFADLVELKVWSIRKKNGMKVIVFTCLYVPTNLAAV